MEENNRDRKRRVYAISISKTYQLEYQEHHNNAEASDSKDPAMARARPLFSRNVRNKGPLEFLWSDDSWLFIQSKFSIEWMMIQDYGKCNGPRDSRSVRSWNRLRCAFRPLVEAAGLSLFWNFLFYLSTPSMYVRTDPWLLFTFYFTKNKVNNFTYLLNTFNMRKSPFEDSLKRLVLRLLSQKEFSTNYFTLRTIKISYLLTFTSVQICTKQAPYFRTNLYTIQQKSVQICTLCDII